jgi:hypothetical protein
MNDIDIWRAAEQMRKLHGSTQQLSLGIEQR